MPTGVFISHAHADQDLAQSLRRLIEASLGLGHDDVTCTSEADYGLARGEDLTEQIRSRLKSAKALFLLATPAAGQKAWVSFECGFAENARDRGEMQFYVLIPAQSYRDAVPEPYRGRVAVTLSNGADVHAFIRQLRRTFKVVDATVPEAGYVDALLDLEQRCATLERNGIQIEHDKQLARNNRVLWLVCAVSAIVMGAGGFLGGVSRGAQQVNQLAAEKSQLAAEKEDLRNRFSQEAMQAETRCEASLKKLPFSGLVYDNSFRPVPCTKVEAQFSDTATGQDRRVPQNCDSGGTFTFLGEQLQSDPRLPIALEVTVGARGLYRKVINRSQAKLAIPVEEIRP